MNGTFAAVANFFYAFSDFSAEKMLDECKVDYFQTETKSFALMKVHQLSIAMISEHW